MNVERSHEKAKALLICMIAWPTLASAIDNPNGICAAGRDDFRWEVQVVDGNGYPCGGVIVGKHWVLTAAHCVVGVDGTNQTVTILAGARLLGDSTEYHTTGHEVYIPTALPSAGKKRKRKGSMSAHNSLDIALIRFHHEFKTPNEAIIELAGPSDEKDGSENYVGGWQCKGQVNCGDLSDFESGYCSNSVLLVYAPVRVISFGNCELDGYGRQGREFVCTEKRLNDGDSGTGLTTAINGHAKLLGIANGVYSLDMYARVTVYAEWIRATMAANTEPAPPVYPKKKPN